MSSPPGKQGKLARDIAKTFNISFDDRTPDHKVFDRIFDLKVKPHLWEPTFVMDYPVEISPLAKKHRSKEGSRRTL